MRKSAELSVYTRAITQRKLSRPDAPNLVVGITAKGNIVTYLSESTNDVPNNLLMHYAALEAPLLKSFVDWAQADATTYD